MKGYWNDPDMTASVLKDGWLKLSDIGYIDKDEFVFLLGRKDDVINSGGVKIAPGEIEEATLELEDIAECVCTSVPDTMLGSVPKLCVVMKENAEFSAKNIYQYLALKLEGYKLPRTIVQIDTLPKTEDNMKVDKRRL
jgi:acyl-CoA synthetase (AMP-forming)/AMP-acid ligase II